MMRKGRNAQPRGERHGRSKLVESDVIEIRRLYKLGVSREEIALKYGVTTNLIYKIAGRNIWRHVP